jgi:hypothetical protein
MSAKVSQLQYDCKVFFCKYNREPIKKDLLYEKVYYEVNKGLQSVSASLNREGMGSATITLSLPLQKQLIHDVLIKYSKETIKAYKMLVSEYLDKREFLITKYLHKGYSSVSAREEAQQELDANTVNSEESENYKIEVSNSDEFGESPTKIMKSDIKGEKWGAVSIDDAIDLDVTEQERSALLYKDKEGNPVPITFYPILNEDFTECIFAPMDKVKFFMSNRFQGETIDDENINKVDKYSQVFEGLISNVNLSYNNGTINLTISVSDVTKWLDLSQFNINPAIASNILDSISPNLGLKVYQTAFAEKGLTEIVKILILGFDRDKDLVPITKSKYENAQEKYEKENKRTYFKDNFVVKDNVTQTSVDWEKVYNQITSLTLERLETYIDLTPEILNNHNIEEKSDISLSDISSIIAKENADKMDNDPLTEYRNDIMPEESEIEKYEKNHSFEEIVTKYYKKPPSNTGCGNFRLLPKGEGLKPGEVSESDNIRLETEYNIDRLWIDPAIPKFTPYRSLFNQFNIFQHNRMKRLEVIKEICAITDFEFYMDSTGILVCKIPDYNLNPGERISEVSDEKEDDNYKEQSTSKNFGISDDKFLIKSSELISYNVSVSDENIKNYCILTGDWKFNMDEVAWQNTDIAYDSDLAKNFGVRILTKSVPLLSGSANSEARKTFAQSWLNRHNAKYKKMDITIPLRPELQLAKTVAFMPVELENLTSEYSNYERYISLLHDYGYSDYTAKQITTLKDIKNKTKVGYISQMTHTWTAGGLCTTKLSLTHLRYWEQKFGTLSYLRSNVVSSADYQRLQSKYINHKNVQDAAYKRHQEALNTMDINNIKVDGVWGNESRKAVNKFLNVYNAENSPQVRLVNETEDGFQRSDVLAAMKKYGLYQ